MDDEQRAEPWGPLDWRNIVFAVAVIAAMWWNSLNWWRIIFAMAVIATAVWVNVNLPQSE